MLNGSKSYIEQLLKELRWHLRVDIHQLVDHTHGLLLAFHHCKPFEPIKGLWAIPQPPPQTLLG